MENRDWFIFGVFLLLGAVGSRYRSTTLRSYLPKGLLHRPAGGTRPYAVAPQRGDNFVPSPKNKPKVHIAEITVSISEKFAQGQKLKTTVVMRNLYRHVKARALRTLTKYGTMMEIRVSVQYQPLSFRIFKDPAHSRHLAK